VGTDRMRRFWDERAKENAFYFVDNRLDYQNPNADRFWAQGVETLDEILALLGVRVEHTDCVVEIGCGVGRLTRPLAERASDVRALDVSGEMLELARRYNSSLENVEWLHGDGASLAGVDSESATVCFSHVVFQHIEDPVITLEYVREMGRVLRPGGWAAFQISNDATVHAVHRERRVPLKERAKSLLGRSPRGQKHPAWLGSHVELDDLRAAAADGGMDVERVEGAGTQFCMVLTRKRGARP
jgi:SAM-dependent methyltransferase